jgi:thiol:disulfide interchange protein DsbD
MNQITKAALAVFLAGFAALPVPARAADLSDLLPVDEAYVVSTKATERGRIEINFKIAKGYYLYKHRFGVAGVDSAFKYNPLQIPAGEKHNDQFFGPVETYRDSVTLVQTGAAASGVDAVTFKLKYQGCADIGVCYPPQTRTITVALPVDGTASATPDGGDDALAGLGAAPGPVLAGQALPEEQAFKAEAIANSPTELLVRLTPAKGYYLYRDKTSFRVAQGEGVATGTPRFPPAKPFHDEHFGDVQVWFDYAEIPVPLQRTNGAAQTITLEAKFQGCLTDGLCYPPMTRNLSVALPAADQATLALAAGAVETPPGQAGAAGGLLVALLSALLGGLILNLMPCVLPVLSFKALGLAQASVSRAHARAHALWYTAGVLASFALAGALVLSLRGAGQALGWGFQLQQPWLVGALALLMLAIGLALSGVVQMGASLAGVGQSLASKSGAAGDFFTGVLAVVVASPCTAPFMAGALGYAFVAPPAMAMLVFLALGLGLALPFLLIGFVPSLAARLPKPGPWMESMKQWLAFPMYLTAVWLAWVFGKQRGVDALGLLLVAAVLLALALWWLERRRYRSGRVGALLPGFALALAIGALVLALRLPSPATAAGAVQAEDGRVPYSAQALAQYRAEGRQVFVDMTADWCITCKVNEKAVLDTTEFAALLQETHTVYMVGDWTDQDAAISAFLDQFHSPGVPLYVVFPAGGGEGKRLPQLLSHSLMRTELAGRR